MNSSIGRRAGLVAVAAGLSAVTGLAAPSANAAGPTPLMASFRSADTLRALEARLGADDTAGYYRDVATNRMVVTVTDEAAAEEVRATGAVARLVERSGAELVAAKTTLDRTVHIAGTTWGIDPVTNQVLITADSTVKGAGLDALKAAAAALGGAARIEYESGVLSTDQSGGDYMDNDASACSTGFNASGGGRTYIITAGHCTDGGGVWETYSGSRIGPTSRSDFPTNDFGAVQYDSTVTRPGDVNLSGTHRDITSAGDSYVGQAIERSGFKTGRRSGTVTAVNVTVNYSAGPVYGMVANNSCADPGDSGGPYLAGTVALGIHSGGSGTCASPGTEYYQPVKEALSTYGLSVY
ncbi:S1 family peptidase [Streptomyces formicae]|nr:S1 family peptidase [Streptomyces formicae]